MKLKETTQSSEKFEGPLPFKVDPKNQAPSTLERLKYHGDFSLGEIPGYLRTITVKLEWKK